MNPLHYLQRAGAVLAVLAGAVLVLAAAGPAAFASITPLPTGPDAPGDRPA